MVGFPRGDHRLFVSFKYHAFFIFDLSLSEAGDILKGILTERPNFIGHTYSYKIYSYSIYSAEKFTLK